MKCAFVIAALALNSVFASPLSKKATAPTDVTDTTVLNYALTLEHLESTFYNVGLANFSEAAFASAGYPDWVRRRFTEIAGHEATHVAALTAVLGSNATSACNYTFPSTDPKSFVALSQILEGVGTAAYTGAATNITNKTYLATAASILATEARHSAWVASAVNMQSAWSTAFETPLDFNEAYTLAAGFITSCPSSNPTLPFTAFPALTFPTTAMPGQSAQVSYNASANASSNSSMYIAFLDGLDVQFVSLNGSMSVTVPAGLNGTVYALLVSNNTAVTDANTIAGPAVLNFPFQ